MNARLLACVILLLYPIPAAAQSRDDSGTSDYPGWRTNTAKRSIDLDELENPGMARDGIPVIDRPRFVKVGDARRWLSDNEPVITLEVNGVSRAYPLQILVWHEVVNDQIGGLPVAVTFCVLCHSAMAFERRLDDRTLSFGISGLLRNADMVLYDRETESWWQQFTGEAIVGDLTGRKLRRLTAHIISFAQFAAAFPEGEVLSRETGFKRHYGYNANVGYDDPGGKPMSFYGKLDGRLKPMEKVIGVEVGGEAKAFPYALSRARRVIHDRVGAQEVVVFHAEGATSALDALEIKKSREVGSTGVFDPRLDGRLLRFSYEGGQFVDAETGSRWNVLGRAVSGSLRGKSLKPIPHGDFFAFAWLAFKPATAVFTE